ncbi:MAG: hypothetical protein NTV23_04375 [Propionibacteriales bacterium]|nr:hypothetical protein [Propionibacteriales bacterium]
MSKQVMDRTAHPIATYRQVSCHELGHSLGVSHYLTLPGNDTVHSCMRNKFAPTGAAWETQYGTHHKSVHINPWFS